MIPRYTKEEFNHAGYFDKLPCECEECHNVFYKQKSLIIDILRHSNFAQNGRFCSHECFNKNKTKNNTISLNCGHCGKNITVKKSKVKERNFCSQNCHRQFRLAHVHKKMHKFTCFWCGKDFENTAGKPQQSHRFCSLSCVARYKHSIKSYGNKRSKLEQWLEGRLSELYPDLRIDYNKTDAINAELDIYIPSIKLGVELNGAVHYEPIFGKDKLLYVQNNDQRKFQACLERGIELCIMNTTGMNRFNPIKAVMYLQAIQNIISAKS
jgi:hypothetical protein